MTGTLNRTARIDTRSRSSAGVLAFRRSRGILGEIAPLQIRFDPRPEEAYSHRAWRLCQFAPSTCSILGSPVLVEFRPMSSFDRRSFMSMLLGSAAGVGLGTRLWAADPVLERGFVVAIKPYTTGVEIARQNQIWEMEVQFKPMRFVTTNVPGKKETEQVWYLAYRAITRPLVKSEVGADVDPVNATDPPPGPHLFVPHMTLITYDDPATEIPAQIIVDRVLPGAVKKINVVERPDSPEHAYLDAVSIVRKVPDPVPVDAELQPWINGVATWSGVDPKTDFFKVIFQGFSNVFEVRGEGDEKRTWRKVLVQKFSRRGDEFDPDQLEFKFEDKPFWEYQPDKKSKADLAAERAAVE